MIIIKNKNMKIRQGFVSNSSSSSFIVIMKDNDELTKESLLKCFDVNEKSPLFKFAETLTDWITSNVKEENITGIYENYIAQAKDLTEDQMIKELCDEWCKYSEEELNAIKNKEARYYEGSACSDSGEGLETFLYENGLEIDTDKIKMYTIH